MCMCQSTCGPPVSTVRQHGLRMTQKHIFVFLLDWLGFETAIEIGIKSLGYAFDA